jgi:hypothetical protein
MEQIWKFVDNSLAASLQLPLSMIQSTVTLENTFNYYIFPLLYCITDGSL